jgi:hypothetical protein
MKLVCVGCGSETDQLNKTGVKTGNALSLYELGDDGSLSEVRCRLLLASFFKQANVLSSFHSCSQLPLEVNLIRLIESLRFL